MERAIAAGMLAFIVGSFLISYSVKTYRSNLKTEQQWQGKPMSLALDNMIRDDYMLSLLLFVMAIGFYGFSIYTFVVTMFGTIT